MVTTCVVVSLKAAVAVSASFVPAAIDRPEGVTEIDVTVALVTVRGVEALLLPMVAVIVAEPAVRPLATPLAEPIVATAVLEEVQAACPVRFLVLPSLNVPTAANRSLVLAAMEGLSGVIAKDARFAALIVSEVFPLTAPEVALMVTLPSLRPVARPLTVMEAKLLPDDAQVTVLVMSCVVESENVPVAVNCCCTPNGMVLPAGVTAIEFRVALVTVRVAVPVTEPEDAVMVLVPAARAMAVPWVGTALLIVATLVLDEVQVTWLVMIFELPSA